MVTVASTLKKHQPCAILCMDALMLRRQESREANSPKLPLLLTPLTYILVGNLFSAKLPLLGFGFLRRSTSCILAVVLSPLTYVPVGNCSLRCSTSGTPDRSILGVVMHFERTCSLHHSYGYGYSSEHAQNASALRDFVHGRTYASKTGVERSHFAKATAPAIAPYLRPYRQLVKYSG